MHAQRLFMILKICMQERRSVDAWENEAARRFAGENRKGFKSTFAFIILSLSRESLSVGFQCFDCVHTQQSAVTGERLHVANMISFETIIYINLKLDFLKVKWKSHCFLFMLLQVDEPTSVILELPLRALTYTFRQWNL